MTMKRREIKNILVIRFRRVGDSVLSMALCHGLRQSFPGARIDFVINEGIHTLYENHPDVDRCIVFNDDENHKACKYIRKVWRTVHDTRYDVIIDMRGTLRTLLFSLFSRFRTPLRIGKHKWYSWLALSDSVRNYGTGKGSRIVQNNMLLEPLRKTAEIKPSDQFRLYVDESRREKMRHEMETHGIDFSRPVILATPTARLEYKVLPSDVMQDLLRRIIRLSDAQIIFNFGGGKEKEAAIRHKHELGDDPHIFTDIEAHSLPDLCALASNCTFFFGNEGGPRHIAQALDVPSFAIFPPGIKKEIWLPNEGSRFAGISPDDIMSADEQEREKLSYSDKMRLLTADKIWSQAKPMISKYCAL